MSNAQGDHQRLTLRTMWLGARLIADQVRLPKYIVHEMVTTELHMRKVCGKLVPKVLTDEQK
jgi:hypothetical protein